MLKKPNQKIFFLNLLLIFNFTNIMSLSSAGCKNKDINFVAKKLETKNPNITCEYKILNKKNCAKYFGKYGKLNYVDKGYQPVLIKFTNKSDKPFEFSLNYFNIPCIPFNILAKYAEIEIQSVGLKSNIVFWLISLGWITAVIGATLYHPFGFLAVFNYSALVGIPYLCWTSYKYATSLPTEPISQNKKLSYDKEIFDKFSKKLLSEQKVEPFSTINGLIFVNKKDLDQYGIAFQENI